jgi:hypothetical protein
MLNDCIQVESGVVYQSFGCGILGDNITYHFSVDIGDYSVRSLPQRESMFPFDELERFF